MSQGEDLDAIDRYFAQHAKDPKAQNTTAQGMANSWRIWFDDLGFFAKCCTDSTLVEAKDRRDKFNAAMGQPDLVSQGFIPADRVPEDQRLDTPGKVAKEFAGGGKPPTITKASKNVALNKKLQTLLNQAGAKPPLKVDGAWGGGTDKALKEFQVKKGLTPDGVVGPATWAALNVKTVSDITAPPPGLPGLTPMKTAPAQGGAQQVLKAAPKAAPAPRTAPKPAPSGIVKTDPRPLAQAGIMGTLDKVPTWGKVVMGAVVAGTAIHLHRQQKEHERYRR